MSPVKNTVRIMPPLENRVARYEAERRALTHALGSLSHEIEHIGSTAVPDLPGKPIIDIAVRLDDALLRVPSLVKPFEAIAYEYLGEFGLPGRHFFVKGGASPCHLHVVDGTTEHWDLWIRFRDILRRNPSVRTEYLALKNELVVRYHADREKYTAGKTEFVTRVLSSKNT